MLNDSVKTLLIVGVFWLAWTAMQVFGPRFATPEGMVCFETSEIAVLQTGEVLDKFGGDPGVLHLDLHRVDHEWAKR